MDAYTLTLLGMAVEATGEDGFLYYRGVKAWVATARVGSVGRRGEGPTLADALAALLRDLGVEVPERPTADDVRSMSDLRGRGQGQFSLAEDLGHLAKVIPLARLREWYARDRLAVLALLEEGS